jgi:GDPmannose 4,6-dehydratase
MPPRTAFITGIAGQDGSYLAEFLLARGYAVHGLVRNTAKALPDYMLPLAPRVQLWQGDVRSSETLTHILAQVQPDETYNLAAQSSVARSWDDPIGTVDINANGLLHLLEAIRRVSPRTRIFQAGSSEMFGAVSTWPQDEATPFRPRNPYGTSKVQAYHLLMNYRERFGLFGCCGFLYSHESPRRPMEFVTRKITHGAARIKLGLARELRLGDLAPRRDWGFAGDHAEAMWRMLQQDTPEDYVIGTGCAHQVRDFVEKAFAQVGLDWRDHVVVDPQFVRPPEPFVFQANADKARQRLGWVPKVKFDAMVAEMVEADLERLQVLKFDTAPRPAAKAA